MHLVDIDRGRADAFALAKTLEDLSRARDAHNGEINGDDDDNLSQDIRDDLEESFSYQRS